MQPLRLSEAEMETLDHLLEYDSLPPGESAPGNGPKEGLEIAPEMRVDWGSQGGDFTPSNRVRIDPDLNLAEVEQSLSPICSCLGCRELVVSWASLLYGATRQQQMDAVYVATFRGVSVHGDASKGEPTQFWVEADPRGLPHSCNLSDALDSRVRWGIVNPEHVAGWRMWSSGWSEGKGVGRG